MSSRRHPTLQGILLDFWQRPIPVDRRQAFLATSAFPDPTAERVASFCSCRPATTREVPEGYFVCRSATNNVFIFLRSFYQDAKILTPAVALVEQSKIYPLNGKGAAKPMKFPMPPGPGQHVASEPR